MPTAVRAASWPASTRLCACLEPGTYDRPAQHQANPATQRDGRQLGDAVRQNPGPHLQLDAGLHMQRDKGAEHHAVIEQQEDGRHGSQHAQSHRDQADAQIVGEQKRRHERFEAVAGCAARSENFEQLLGGGSRLTRVARLQQRIGRKHVVPASVIGQERPDNDQRGRSQVISPIAGDRLRETIRGKSTDFSEDAFSRRKINDAVRRGGKAVEIDRQAFVACPRADLRQVNGHAAVQHVEAVHFLRIELANGVLGPLEELLQLVPVRLVACDKITHDGSLRPPS